MLSVLVFRFAVQRKTVMLDSCFLSAVQRKTAQPPPTTERLFQQPAPVDFFEHVQSMMDSIQLGGEDVLQAYTSEQALRRYTINYRKNWHVPPLLKRTLVVRSIVIMFMPISIYVRLHLAGRGGGCGGILELIRPKYFANMSRSLFTHWDLR